MIVIAGGEADPNLARLIERIRGKGNDCLEITIGAQNNPKLSWELETNTLLVNDQAVEISGAFVRYDVFNQLADNRIDSGFRAGAWYTTLVGWLLSNNNIRLLNREYAQQVTNKPYVLHLAKLAGLEIPDTVISNDMANLQQLQKQKSRVVKPVNGGGYCQPLSALINTTQTKQHAAASPAIIQNELVPPEIRIFGIKDQFFAFQVVADTLDYRTALQCVVEAVYLDSLPKQLIDNLYRLMQRLGMDFGAADFKACPETGKLLFLEINSSPMFVRFDQTANFKLSDAIVNYLYN